MTQTSLADRCLRLCVGAFAGGVLCALISLPFVRTPEPKPPDYKPISPWTNTDVVSAEELYQRTLDEFSGEDFSISCAGYGQFVVEFPDGHMEVITRYPDVSSGLLNNRWQAG